LVHRPDEFRKAPALRIYSRPLLGNGLLTSEGQEHRAHRRLVAPAFAHQRVPRYADVMSESSLAACETWTDNSVVDIHRAMTRLTLGIVGRTLFDVDLLNDADEIGKHMTALILFATRQTRSLRPQAYDRGRIRARAQESIDRLNRTIFGMIEQRRKSDEDKGDVLSMLLQSRDEDGNRLSDEQVRDEAMTLFVAGHETTANASTWALYLLARHPEIQTALQRQVRDAVGARPLTFDDLPNIPLSLEVFKESMRLFPPAYIVVREPLQDLELSGGVQLRKGELVAMCEYNVHRNPKYFPDPERFDPTRFTPENEAKIPRYAYFPFGAGRRICIGNQFALMEGQIILGTLMQHVTVSPLNAREWKGDPLLTLRPKGPARLRVTRV
jgi:cytochrome P450